MGWLEAVFGGRKPKAAGPVEHASEAVTVEDGRPSWATGTSLYRTVGHLVREEPCHGSAIVVTPDPDAAPLPRRVRS